MWHYDFVFPSLMVFSIILCYYFALPRLPIRLNRTFLHLLISEMGTIASDYVATRMDEHFASFPAWALWASNMVFFLFFVSRIYLFFRFTCDVFHPPFLRAALSAWLSRLVLFAALLMILLSPWTGWIFRIDETGYHSGPLYNALYVCSFFYLLAGLAVVYLGRKQLSRFELYSMLGYHLILLLGFSLRFILPMHLVMNAFTLMAVLIIYLTFENPDLYLSHRGKSFNTHALRDMLQEVRETGHCQLLAFAICDYNDQRTINGGKQMDRCISMISQYLLRYCHGALVFYLHGGCFAVLSGSQVDGVRLKEDIRRRFERPWSAEGVHLYLEPVFVRMDRDLANYSPDQIIDTLKIALGRAGKAASPEDLESTDAIHRSINVKKALEKCLEEDRVEVFLQPIFSSRDRKIIGAEALARIRDAEGRLIPPADFIPLAERSGDIIDLGEQVLRKVSRFIREHDIRAMGLQWINVNLSPVQCTRGDLADRFEAVLREDGVDPELVHLEITEQSMIDYMLLRRQMESLNRLGFRFALDDYGSGYSNLVRVRRFPFNNIKMDMELVWDYMKERDSLLPTLVQVFRSMGFSITAEGVENEETVEAMKQIGCDYLQGFFFSRPLPMEEFVSRYNK